MRCAVTSALAMCAVMALAPALSAVEVQNWPSFRGANAGGVADGTPTAVSWDVKTGEHVLWKTPIPGLSVSSPIVWGDRVFVSTAISSDPNQAIRTGLYGDVEPVNDASKHSWHLIALDKKSGKVVWDRVASEGVPKTKRHPKSSQASPTPVTDGTHVIVSFGSQGLYAYDFTGKLLWNQDLGVLNAGWFFDPDYEWGVGSSPIIYKNMVIVQCDIQRNSFIAAFDTSTGKQLWRTAREEIPSWSTPTIVEANGKTELVTQATTFIRGYDPSNGKELWKLSGNSEITIPTPIAGPGFVVVTNGYRGVQPIFAIKPGGSGDITLKEGQTKSDTIAWSSNRGGPYIPTPVIYGEHLYVLQTNGVLAAYKIATGERVYQQRLGDGGAFSASVVAADGKIYCSSEDGDVYVVKAGAAYELLAKNSFNETLMATPAVSDGLLIFRGSKTVYAIQAR
ncbi:MAG TPA: PQQ-binding-like beta-propeller repeat protein [Vicinamibacterales bacterium]|nr:PQQ-binding-like beta-propeller repeat protein [Vicinamibacterales bacterium]